jgi:ribosome maturation factor RimP
LFVRNEENSLEIREKIEKTITPIAEKYGQEVVDIIPTSNSKGLLIKITVGSKEGPKVSDIVSITKEFNKFAAAAGTDFLPEDTQLEVSSPGIDRDLKTFKDFLWNEGREIKLIYKKESEDVRIEGSLYKADETGIVVSSEEGKITIPYENIVKAKLKIKF